MTCQMTVMSTQTHFEARNESVLRRLVHDRDGNFAIMTALLMPIGLMAVGMAIDLNSAVNVRTDVQSLIDSAALAGAAVYDGTNPTTAAAATRKLLDRTNAQLPAGMTFSVSVGVNTVSVTANGAVDTNMMQIANVVSVPIAASAVATRPLKPVAATFTADSAQGWYYKLITVRVVRPGSSAEETLATITYTPTKHSVGGTMAVSPQGQIELGDYTKLVLQMDIKNDGCPLGYKNPKPSNNEVVCNKADAKKSADAASFKYDNVLRTDDPATSDHIFVNGVQRANGNALDYTEILACTGEQKHSWEDQVTVSKTDTRDFFYTVVPKCVFEDEVRLTQ